MRLNRLVDSVSIYWQPEAMVGNIWNDPQQVNTSKFYSGPGFTHWGPFMPAHCPLESSSPVLPVCPDNADAFSTSTEPIIKRARERWQDNAPFQKAIKYTALLKILTLSQEFT